MYTLRTIQEQTEHNQMLGSNYSVIRRDESPEEFRDIFKRCFGREHVSDGDETADKYTKDTYAIICNNDGLILIPLYKGEKYFVMTENGNTFSNLTYKG